MGLKQAQRTKVFYGPATISGEGGFYYGKTLDIRIGDVVILGRDRFKCTYLYPPKCTEISKIHCYIRIIEGLNRIGVTDRSKNGTFLARGERMDPTKEYYLADGDRFYLAKKENMFVVHMV